LKSGEGERKKVRTIWKETRTERGSIVIKTLERKVLVGGADLKVTGEARLGGQKGGICRGHKDNASLIAGTDITSGTK